MQVLLETLNALDRTEPQNRQIHSDFPGINLSPYAKELGQK
jgi:hypothetical protein